MTHRLVLKDIGVPMTRVPDDSAQLEMFNNMEQEKKKRWHHVHGHCRSKTITCSPQHRHRIKAKAWTHSTKYDRPRAKKSAEYTWETMSSNHKNLANNQLTYS